MEILNTRHPGERSSREDPTLSPIPAPDALCGLKILIIDDELDHRIFIARVLERFGASSRIVGSVSDAFKILAQYEPDVIISDIAMPDQDGYDFIRIFRSEHEDPSAKQTPVIALSAYTERHWQVKSILEGFQLHLSKPIHHRRLVATVAQLAH